MSAHAAAMGTLGISVGTCALMDPCTWEWRSRDQLVGYDARGLQSRQAVRPGLADTALSRPPIPRPESVCNLKTG
jgi:hypothetical protein